MSKRINYDRTTHSENSGTILTYFSSQNEKICIEATNFGCGANVYFSDPSKLRALAAEITKAADALEASQQLTFDDLAVGEFFYRAYEPGYIYVKITEERSLLVKGLVSKSAAGCIESTRCPLVRLKASFEEVES